MRVAIVDDTLMAVESLRRVLIESGDYQVAWIAHNGQEAVEQCNKDTPDLILMDLVMPVMEGVEATRLIMANTPCPILIVTSSVSKYAQQVFAAMGYGALDAVNTPILSGDGSARGKSDFLSKIATIKQLSSTRDSIKSINIKNKSPTYLQTSHKSDKHLIVIGSSAGGPQALHCILSALPAAFPLPIVIVQHIDALFSDDLSKWLDKCCNLTVKIAENGDHPRPGMVLLGGTNDHLVLNKAGCMEYTADPIEEAYRPSVNIFFKSVLEHWQGNITALLLTGMGRDGAQGLLHFKERGFYTIAQDEKSCAVYGMPRAAAELNAAVDILPLDKIATRLIALGSQV
ncbi:MAG TPA: chemotaxis response regulator protein-glutamate methylesterase [Sedimenticola sp.]|nr:chemotaxis response regulator protein-glutamate methylesterase [Sedimenticola sp.]